jgi:hypothetical protein
VVDLKVCVFNETSNVCAAFLVYETRSSRESSWNSRFYTGDAAQRKTPLANGMGDFSLGASPVSKAGIVDDQQTNQALLPGS